MNPMTIGWLCLGLIVAGSGPLVAETAAGQAPAKPAQEAHDEHGHADGGGAKKDEKGHEDEAGHGEQGAHGEEEPWADRVGEGKAVEAFDEAGRLKLAEKAIARMGIKAAPMRAEGPGLRVPLAAVQRSKGKAFIYVSKADRWYERRPATLLSRDRNSALLSAKVAMNELVVTEGSASLRAAELDLLAGESAGHGH